MWKDDLQKCAGEETEDHANYLKLADDAESDGYPHEAGVLRDIAHEEYTHHKLIEEILHKM